MINGHPNDYNNTAIASLMRIALYAYVLCSRKILHCFPLSDKYRCAMHVSLRDS